MENYEQLELFPEERIPIQMISSNEPARKPTRGVYMSEGHPRISDLSWGVVPISFDRRDLVGYSSRRIN